MRLSSTWYAVPAALLGSLSAACANTAPDREPLPSQLDRLRVLAIAADPPDLVPGESATLSALVFEPSAEPVAYAWSWCPVSVDADSGAACPIEESLWAEIWQSAGLAGAPPGYDLGSEPTAALQPNFEPDTEERLCAAIDALGPVAEPARVACVDGFEASIVLIARAAGDEEVSSKSVPFLPDGTPPEARNHNPEPLGDVSVSGAGTDEPPISDATLVTGRTYALRVELDEGLSETLPEAPAGDAEATGEARETLVLSWFVTPGELRDPAEDDQGFGPFEDDTQRTVYVPGQSDLEEFLENGWSLPFSDRPAAELILVLRDGRGGVAWRQYDFALVGETP
ncbi:MAG: hypothetical protein ABW217_11245 [Polyangiaceae bacterium]